MKNKIQWTPEAEARVNKAPFFIRGVARKKIEKAALSLGEKTISIELLEKIKKQEMGR